MKKVLSVLLVLAMSISILAGCGNKKEDTNADDTNKTTTEDQNEGQTNDKNNEEAEDDTLEPFEVTMLYADNANYPYKEDWLVWDIIEEHTGARIKVQAVPESDYEAKRQIVFNSGNIPDIVTKTFPTTEMAMSGLLLPISEYEDQMPNYKAWIEKYDMREDVDNLRLSDGNYYMLPVKAHTSRIQDQQWLVRTDILEENNIPIPTNLDELYEAGVKLKEIYPDSTPITNRFGTGNIMSGFAGAFGTIAGWTLGDGAYYVREEDKWEFAPTTDKWKGMLEYTKKLYDAGVLDEEFATLDSTSYEQKILQGKTFFMYDWTANISRYNLQGTQNNPDYNVTPVYPIEGVNGNYALGWKAAWAQAWVFPSDLAERENFDQILKFIDWCYTDEAETLLTFGIEGETYVEEDGVLKFKDPNVDYYATAGLDNNALAVRQHEDFLYGVLNDEQIELFEQIAEDNIVKRPNPASPLSLEEIEESKIYSATLVDYVNTMMEKFIYGTESLDNWDEFVKQCEESGSIKLIEMYNNAWANRGK